MAIRAPGLAAIVFGFMCLLSRPSAAAEMFLSKGQLVFVPAYSHIVVGDRQLQFDLSIVLSVRNLSSKVDCTLLSVDYYNDQGTLVRRYLGQAQGIKPMSSAYFYVKESDMAGGIGASFLIRWAADTPMAPPLLESIMIGTKSQQGLSFVSRGVVVEESGH